MSTNHSWPHNRTPIGCKWVFRAERDATGHVVRYKARLVAKGFAQVHGVDFHDILHPWPNSPPYGAFLQSGQSWIWKSIKWM